MSTGSRTVIIAALVLGVPAIVALRLDGGRSTGAVCPAPPVVGASGASTAGAAAGLPRLVELGADTCIPCKAMVPVLDALRRDFAGRLKVDFIDVVKHPDQAAPFNIYAMPTQVFLDASGRELYRHLGFFSKEDIVATWRKLGVRLDAGGKG